MAEIVISPPREAWADEFRALAALLRPALPPGASIYHIGSTAVPGLAAKDIIDIQVGVDALDSVDHQALAALGFTHRPGLVDHCPPGRDLPVAELTKLFFKGPDARSNVHVRERGRFNHRFALVCRDYLRTHPVAAGAYALVKQHLAARFPDSADDYYDIKDPVFDIIVEGANEWALRTGWSEPSGD